jgi:hypothetical protein
MSRLVEKRAERTSRLLGWLAEIAALSEGITVEELRTPQKGSTSRMSKARQLYYWLAENTYGKHSRSDAARFIGRTHAAAWNQLNVFEWRRQREQTLVDRCDSLRRRIMQLGAEDALIQIRSEAAIEQANKLAELRAAALARKEKEAEPEWYEASAYHMPGCAEQNARFAAHWRNVVGEARWP